jgi:hypothetical protein
VSWSLAGLAAVANRAPIAIINNAEKKVRNTLIDLIVTAYEKNVETLKRLNVKRYTFGGTYR